MLNAILRNLLLNDFGWSSTELKEIKSFALYTEIYLARIAIRSAFCCKQRVLTDVFPFGHYQGANIHNGITSRGWIANRHVEVLSNKRICKVNYGEKSLCENQFHFFMLWNVLTIHRKPWSILVTLSIYSMPPFAQSLNI